MTTNVIKKLVYKQKPTADLEMIRGGNLYYNALLTSMEDIQFIVPISDIGTTDFFPEMEAKHLLRWLVNEEN